MTRLVSRIIEITAAMLGLTSKAELRPLQHGGFRGNSVVMKCQFGTLFPEIVVDLMKENRSFHEVEILIPANRDMSTPGMIGFEYRAWDSYEILARIMARIMATLNRRAFEIYQS